MSLKFRIAIIVALVGFIYILTVFFINQLLILPKFAKLEYIEAQKDIDRVVSAVEREKHHLENFASDWAWWDDTYSFVQNNDKDYEDSNLIHLTFTENNINLLYILDISGNILWGKTLDFETEKEIVVEEFTANGLLNHQPLIHGKDSQKPITGVMITKTGILLLSSSPILTSKMEGPAKGTLIMGRFINKKFIQTLLEQTKTNLMMWNVRSTTLPDVEKSVYAKMQQEGTEKKAIEPVNDSLLNCYAVINDYNNHPTLLARISVQRYIFMRGKKAVFFATVSLAVAGAIFIILLLLLLNIFVTHPLSILTKNVIKVSQTSNFIPFEAIQGGGEVSVLNQEFNSLICKLDNEITDHKYTITKLESAISEVKVLRGILPICAYCKNIRNDEGYYEQIEGYIHKHSGVDFSHTICPACMEEHYPEEYRNLLEKQKGII